MLLRAHFSSGYPQGEADVPRVITGLVAALLLASLSLGVYAVPADSPQQAVLVTIKGPIGPATADYFSHARNEAIASRAPFIILQMDTPGGLDTAMRDIIKGILSSPIPIIGYVAPNGARAASAGTYILYACHIAAMAPATNLGAATPVRIGSSGAPPVAGEKNGGAASNNAMSHKIINDAVAYIRSLARLRGRNADWAEKAVRQAASLDAREALNKHVIDVIADNTTDLLAQINGRTVQVPGGQVTLHTGGVTVRTIEPDWRTKLLGVLTNPNIAYILMLIGIYGLIFEFASPGGIVPGVIGAICLLIALFALQVLPINYAGLGLMLLGIGLMVGEAFVPSFGILGIGGVAAFVIGSVMLIDTSAPGFGISLAVIGAGALFSVLLFITVVGLIIRARRRTVVTGREEMIGTNGTAFEDFETEGLVRVHGELWKAISDAPVKKGQNVKVVSMEGLCLKVTPSQNRGA